MRHAQSMLEVGVYPLSRLDRAAMVLAYEQLRRPAATTRDSVDDALDTLFSRGAAVAFRVGSGGCYSPEERMRRVRLALLLRVLLRVDRGDYGPFSASAERCYGDEHLGPSMSPWPGHAVFVGGPRHMWAIRARFTPLWEQCK